MSIAAMSVEAKSAMIANFQLEISARKEKLRSMCEAQCASLRSRLERRVNRVPASKRRLPLTELLASPPPAPKPAPVKAAVVKKAPAVAPPARKTRAAPAANATKTAPMKEAVKEAPRPAAPKEVPKSAALKEAPKPAVRPTIKPTTIKAIQKTTVIKETKPLRGRKRGSDEMSNEDKENAAELEIPKKRVRAAPAKASVVNKPAAPARTTRAASKKGAIPSQVLSPKNNNARQRPGKAATRTK